MSPAHSTYYHYVRSGISLTTTNTGFIIWFTGLSGSGKTTVARILEQRIRESGHTFESLDGDVVRTNLSKGLGFSKEDRDTNIRRIGFVAHLLERNGVAVICSAISPYRQTRDELRMMVGDNFIEVFADCPIEICETRDGKVEMYAKARRGEIKEFTGVSDPYEAPETPEVHLKTHLETAEQSAETVLAYLVERGLLKSDVLRQPAVK
jgi:adenylylsulfate kinase